MEREQKKKRKEGKKGKQERENKYLFRISIGQVGVLGREDALVAELAVQALLQVLSQRRQVGLAAEAHVLNVEPGVVNQKGGLLQR